MEEMIKKILNWYTGNNVKKYEKDRNNKKWAFEQNFVEEFIHKHLDIDSVIDAPLGTNRFGKVIDNCNHITKFIGLDLSTDMLTFADNKKTKKLSLEQHDLIKEKCEKKGDLVLIIRMLNLFDTKISLKILDNLLPAAKKYCIATLRYDKEYSFIENKIHIQPINVFLDKIISHDFNYSIFDYKDERKGNFSIVLMTKNLAKV